jgi:ABC-type nitrate/sulfonate/bicarbonate transport system substrate-binding protein
MKKILAIFILLTGLPLLAGCGAGNNAPAGEDSETLKPVTIMLDWIPNTNHTGLYVALDKGWYAEEGLDVEIIEPTQGGTSQLVATGTAEFGVGYQEDVTLARANDVPIVSLAAVIQHNTSGFASKKALGITRPREMEGKTYGGWGSPAEEAMIKAVMDKDGGDSSKVNTIDIGTADFFTAIERDIDFAWIYYGWTGIEAEQRGLELNYLELRRLHPALDYYTPVIVTSEQLLASDPELVQKFMRATSKGYRFAINNPAEAGQILLKYAPELDADLVQASQEYLSPRYQDDAPRWGEQDEEIWTNYAAWMYENELLPTMIDVEKAFNKDFLTE